MMMHMNFSKKALGHLKGGSHYLGSFLGRFVSLSWLIMRWYVAVLPLDIKVGMHHHGLQRLLPFYALLAHP